MTISEFSVKRPVSIFMFTLILIVMGLWSLSTMKLDLLPDIEMPTLTVITSYPGASSEEIERIVSEPLEKGVGSVTNLKSVKSSSRENVSLLTIEFESGTDTNVGAQDVRDALDLVMSNLPDEVNRPIIAKMDTSQMPVLVMGVSGMDDTIALKDLVDDKITDRLKRLNGVGSVMVMGGDEREIQVQMNYLKMQELGIPSNAIVSSLGAQNLNLPAGIIDEGQREFMLRSLGEFDSVEDIESTIVGTTSYGEPVHLRDVAEVIDGKKETRSYMRTDRKQGVALMITKQSSANTASVSKIVKKELEQIAKELPSNIVFYPIMDQGKQVSTVIAATGTNALVGGLLAVIFIFFFLHGWRPTFAIGVAIPVSIIATFIPIKAAGYSLNIMTLGGLALGVGMLVDNAVVVIENIYRNMETGKNRKDAASTGASQVGMAIIASTFTTIAVFLPMSLSSGIAGQLSRGLSLTVSFSLLASLIVALTVVPMIASKIFKKQEERHTIKNKNAVGPMQIIRGKYGKILTWTLKSRRIMLSVLVLIMIITVGAGWFFVGKEFMPKSDTGMITLNLELPVGARLSETDIKAGILEDIALSIPEVERVLMMVGSSGEAMMASFGPTGSNQAMAMIKLYDEDQRTGKRSDEEILNEIRDRFPDFPGVKLENQDMASSSMMGGSSSAIDIKIFGKDLDRTGAYALEIEKAISTVEGVVDAHSSLEQGKPEIGIKINKEKAMRLGLPVAVVAGQLRTLTLGTVSTRLREKNGNETDIRVRLREKDRLTRKTIESLPINLPMGGTIPLKEVADFKDIYGPIEIEHEEQTRMVHVYANRTGRNLGDIVTDIKIAIAPVVEKFPSGYSYELGGENETMKDSFKDLGLAMIMAIILVYAIMAALFESITQPLVILVTLPLAAIGVVWIFLITGSTLSIVSFMGIIILIGIVVNNGIVLIDHINQLRRNENMEKHQALVQGGMDRLRPILITAGTTILGMLPMAFSTGQGASMKGPMALTVVGGLITSTFFTLFYVPLFYSIADHISYKTTKKMTSMLHGSQEEA